MSPSSRTSSSGAPRRRMNRWPRGTRSSRRYLGNYYYNISNKTALKAAGGALGYPMTISTLQLGVGSIYALFLRAAPWATP